LLALTQQGLRAAVETYVSTADQSIKDAWQFATVFEQGNSMIAAASLGKTPADVDELFVLAKTLLARNNAKQEQWIFGITIEKQACFLDEARQIRIRKSRAHGSFLPMLRRYGRR
jgi:hypothetical protein